MTSERFQAVLLEIRDQASGVLSGMVYEEIKEGEQHDAKIEDARAVWYATEVALGVLDHRYLPKREAIDDIRSRIEYWPT
jgi:hypothetical protein